MIVSDFLEKILRSFESYYNIKREGVVAPFYAEAEFHSQNEMYFLVKAAKLDVSDSNEYVFFAASDNLTGEKLKELDEAAWNEGCSRIKPYYGHRNSDITLVIAAEKIDSDVGAKIKKLKRYKSYAFSFKGWSHYRVIALETSSNRLFFNRMGSDLKKLFRQ